MIVTRNRSTLLTVFLVGMLVLSISKTAIGADPITLISYTSGSPVIPCCEKSVPTLVASREFTTAEIDYIEASFVAQFSGCMYYSIRSSSSRTNCHAYAFGSSRWINDPSNYLGSSTGCYKVDSNGEIFRFTGHSALSGGGYGDPPHRKIYLAKCRHGPVAMHDTCLYGSHYERWKMR